MPALEFACLDLQGQALGKPVCDLLGGRLVGIFTMDNVGEFLMIQAALRRVASARRA